VSHTALHSGHMTQLYEAYVRSRTLANWKFWIVSFSIVVILMFIIVIIIIIILCEQTVAVSVVSKLVTTTLTTV